MKEKCWWRGWHDYCRIEATTCSRNLHELWTVLESKLENGEWEEVKLSCFLFVELYSDYNLWPGPKIPDLAIIKLSRAGLHHPFMFCFLVLFSLEIIIYWVASSFTKQRIIWVCQVFIKIVQQQLSFIDDALLGFLKIQRISNI